MTVTDDQWRASRSALQEVGGRFADLVSSTPPATMATAHWSVADTAAHVAVVASFYAHLARPEATPHPFGAFIDRLEQTTTATVADLNERALREHPERDPQELAARLRADIATFLAATEGDHPPQPLPWLGGSQVPLAGLAAHLLNELLIHGWDIARATRSQWEIPPAYAAMFFELFMVGMISSGYGRLLDDNKPPPPDRRTAVEFRSPHTSPVTLALDNGLVVVEEPRADNDVRVRFDPPTMNLMLFGRLSRARAALTGKVVAWGRRPWLLPDFLRTMRLPS